MIAGDDIIGDARASDHDRVGGVHSIATVVDDLTGNCGNDNEADYLLRRW